MAVGVDDVDEGVDEGSIAPSFRRLGGEDVERLGARPGGMVRAFGCQRVEHIHDSDDLYWRIPMLRTLQSLTRLGRVRRHRADVDQVETASRSGRSGPPFCWMYELVSRKESA